MQSIIGYGFRMLAPDNCLENEYQEIKDIIERACRFAEHQCKAAEQSDLNFALRAGDGMFITISVHNGKAEFAMLDRKNDCLIQECDISMLKKYVDEDKMDLLSYRIENECDAIARGNILNRTTLDQKWRDKHDKEDKVDKYIQETEKVIQQQKRIRHGR